MPGRKFSVYIFLGLIVAFVRWTILYFEDHLHCQYLFALRQKSVAVAGKIFASTGLVVFSKSSPLCTQRIHSHLAEQGYSSVDGTPTDEDEGKLTNVGNEDGRSTQRQAHTSSPDSGTATASSSPAASPSPPRELKKPLLGKQVCLFLKGEIFRSGRKGAQTSVDIFERIPRIGRPPKVQLVVDAQKRASESQVREIISPLEELGAEVKLFLDTMETAYAPDIFARPAAEAEGGRVSPEALSALAEQRNALFRSYYNYGFGGGTSTSASQANGATTGRAGGGRQSQPPPRQRRFDKFLVREREPPNRDPRIRAKPHADVLESWWTDFAPPKENATSSTCSGGLLWTRPDLIFRPAMGASIRTAGWDEKENEKPVSSPPPPEPASPLEPRYSFVKKQIVPLDLSKLLFLAAAWTASDTIGRGHRGQGRWRVIDTFGYIPQKIMHELWSDPALPKSGVLREHEAIGAFDEQKQVGGEQDQGEHQKRRSMASWVADNIRFIALNSQHDSDSSRDWNPFYRMANRGEKLRDAKEDNVSREAEERVANVALGFAGVT